MASPQTVEERTVELLEKIVKQNADTQRILQGCFEKIRCAEIRQTQSSAEGTDAARMLLQYVKAESALWSSHGQAAILEMVYRSQKIEAIEYAGVWAEKDKRRAEFAVAIFWQTFVEESSHVHDIFEDDGEHPRGIYQLLPTFRKTLLENARLKDNELGKARQEPYGSYVEVVTQALGPMPSGLQYLHELRLPLNKRFKGAPRPSNEMVDVEIAFEGLPDKVKKAIEWAQGNKMVSTSDKEMATTELVVKWCRYIKPFVNMAKEISLDEFYTSVAKRNAAQAESDAKTDEAFFERKLEDFKGLHDIKKKFAELEAKKAASEKANDGPAESSGETGH